MKQYIGISRDHSGSMQSLARAAARDYNATISSIKTAAQTENIDTVVSVVKCGVYNRVWGTASLGGVVRETVNSSIAALQPLPEHGYTCDGQTPLFDSVGELIEIMKTVPDAADPQVSFLIMAITDGEENASSTWKHKLGEEIKKLQATDRWTFVFRVPRGYGRQLTSLGIPAGNILEWETTERGLSESSIRTQQAFTSYYQERTRGLRSTGSFYANAAQLTKSEVRQNLRDISREVQVWPVSAGGYEIRPFVESKLNHDMRMGAAFYQLSKPEKSVQEYKKIAIRDKSTGTVYAGAAARDMLGLPQVGNISLSPGDHGQWEIYVQSTSVNRKLVAGTNVLYWPGV